MVITSLSEEQKLPDDIAEADKQNTPTATDSDGKDKTPKTDLLYVHRAVFDWQRSTNNTTNTQQNATVAAPTGNTQHNSGRTDMGMCMQVSIEIKIHAASLLLSVVCFIFSRIMLTPQVSLWWGSHQFCTDFLSAATLAAWVANWRSMRLTAGLIDLILPIPLAS